MSTDHMALFEETLAEHGYHITKARRATFELLVSPEPQSMREILARANGQVDRVSIYRNIDLFEKIGIVHRIYIGWKYKLELSDTFMPHHHHVTCLGCGKVFDIKDDKAVEEFIHTIATKLHFEPREHQFEISGYCLGCQNKKARTT